MSARETAHGAQGEARKLTAAQAVPVGVALETETCSKCGQGTGWEWDELEGWTSVCCARPPKALPADA